MKKNIEHIPICPKCGYDQSGIISNWEDQCPMRGRCSECGFDFSWGDVLDPSRIELKWYVEHARTTREMIVRTIPTLWYLLFPNRYWRRLGMEAPRSLNKYIVWVGAMLLTMHLLITVGFVLTHYVGTANNNVQMQALSIGASPVQQRRISGFIYDIEGVDYWYPIIGEAFLTPIISNQIWTDELALGAGMFGVLCLGISIMWFVLFSAFPTTRKRSKLRMVHVLRAMVVGGLLPLVAFEIGRMLDLLVFVGEYWAPMSNIDSTIAGIAGSAVIVMLVWIQWFWISGVRIGWKVKANWFEMLLVMLASFFGLVFAGGIIALLRIIGSGIAIAAYRAGIV